LIGSKWVFKVKKDGTYCARLVALGYNQVPGDDFTDNYAPVINDVTFRLVLLIYLLRKMDSEIIDVEAAFLYGIFLKEEIFMKSP
jgi:Reverse transcriptase (RNA-dependent DNA polymerase)